MVKFSLHEAALECLPEQIQSKTKVFPHFKIRFSLTEGIYTVLYTAYEPLPKGSLKYFNQFPIIYIANLQSVLVPGIDPLNGFDFVCSF